MTPTVSGLVLLVSSMMNSTMMYKMLFTYHTVNFENRVAYQTNGFFQQITNIRMKH